MAKGKATGMSLENALNLVEQWCVSYHGCGVTPGASAQDHVMMQQALKIIHEACMPDKLDEKK